MWKTSNFFAVKHVRDRNNLMWNFKLKHYVITVWDLIMNAKNNNNLNSNIKFKFRFTIVVWLSLNLNWKLHLQHKYDRKD